MIPAINPVKSQLILFEIILYSAFSN